MGALTITNIIVIVSVMGLVTYAGHLASKSHINNSKAFFTADGGLPWWAVSASLYATVVSAVSFVSIPASVFRENGNLELMQIDFGASLGRLLIAVLFVRAYFDSRSINTVYQYLSVRISKPVSRGVMALAFILTILIYSIVVLAAALVLNVLTEISVPMSCLVIVSLSVLWSCLGGIRTVVWTDFVMLCIFLFGALLSAAITFGSVNLPLTESFAVLDQHSKLKLLDLSLDPSKAYTLWTALFSSVLGGAALASTQSGMQRVRACHSVEDARKAFMFATVFFIVPVFLYIVGMGLFVFYNQNGVPKELAEHVATQPDQVFPYFIVNEIPNGISGLLIAAIFVASISTLNSRLAELSNVSVSDIYRQFINKNSSEEHYLRAARFFIVLWGVVFCAISIGLSAIDGQNLLELTYAFWNVIMGPMMGVFFLARFRIGDTISVVVGTICAFLFAYLSQSAGVTGFWSLPASVVIMMLVAWVRTPRRFDRTGVVSKDLVRTENRTAK